jgi:hypothetical protein
MQIQKFTCLILLFFGLVMPAHVSFAMENNPITASESQEPDKQEKSINPWRLAAKIAVGSAGSLYAHHVLEYISTFAHEHGHGIAGGNPDYFIELTPTKNPLMPWKGACFGGNGSFTTIIAGPLAGICTTYIQCIALETLKGYLHGSSLKESAQQGLHQPFLFLSQLRQTVKDYCSYMVNTADTEITEPSWSQVFLNSLMFLRCGRIIGETIYGLMPYSFEGGNGDGEKIWKMMLGQKCPTFKADLMTLTCGVLLVPSFCAMADILTIWNNRNKPTEEDNATTASNGQEQSKDFVYNTI